jgi:thiosulfate/3-mercaptopyruvate sulfurtransferase
MKDHCHRPRPVLTRRQALGAGLVIGIGAVIRTSGIPPAVAEGTPGLEAGTGYARPEGLVTAEWLRENLDDPSLVLVGFMSVDEFEVARIPGSVQIDWPELEVIDTSDASIEGWREDTQQLLGNLGIAPDRTVVVYDNGTLFAARLWWILHYLGHENVHVLDGGLPAWQDVDDAVETGPFDAPSGGDAYRGTPNPDLLAQLDEVMESLDDPDVVILDARTPEEHAEGHIPGAVNLNFPLNASSEPPKVWKPADELQTMYDDVGATPEKMVIPYCASGVRSAVTAFTLHLLGYENIALYTGSWLEWGENPHTPKAEGNKP